MAPRGRPPSYKPEYASQSTKLCKLGATDVELADFFGVSIDTVTKWKATQPEFSASLKVGKSDPDDKVERSLYQRAVGYTFDTEEIFCKDGEVTRVPVRKHVPPDTTACIFWLKNRRQQEWRDVHKLEHGRPGDFDGKSAEELRQFVVEESQALGLPAPGMKRLN